jgi:hypothetical protein
MADTQPFGDKLNNTNDKIFKIVIYLLLLIGFIEICYELNKNNLKHQSVQNHKIDSLNKVIDSLQTEIFYLEDGFDHKEHIYEQALYDCEHRRRLRRQKHKGQLKQQFRYE